MRKPKSVTNIPLHQFIATGGKPKDFKGCKGVNKDTVPGYKGRK